MTTKSHITEAERIYIRDFETTDFDAVHEYAMLPDFSQFEVWGPNAELDTRKFIETTIEQSKYTPRFVYEMAIILKSDQHLIGSIRLGRETEDSCVASLGYAINPKFQGKGYATEATRALIKFGFKTLNLLVIYASCDTRNIASQKVLEKSGMHRVGCMIGDRKIRGKIYDSYRYEIHA